MYQKQSSTLIAGRAIQPQIYQISLNYKATNNKGYKQLMKEMANWDKCPHSLNLFRP